MCVCVDNIVTLYICRVCLVLLQVCPNTHVKGANAKLCLKCCGNHSFEVCSFCVCVFVYVGICVQICVHIHTRLFCCVSLFVHSLIVCVCMCVMCVLPHGNRYLLSEKKLKSITCLVCGKLGHLVL